MITDIDLLWSTLMTLSLITFVAVSCFISVVVVVVVVVFVVVHGDDVFGLLTVIKYYKTEKFQMSFQM